MVHCGSAPTDSASCDWIQIEHRRRGTSNSEDPDQLAGDLVVGLFRDHEGSFWAHTKRGDVYRFEPRPPFRSYRHQAGNPRSLIDDFVIAAYEDTRGMLWVGTERGLNRIDRQSGLVTRYREPPFNRGVRSIAEDGTGSLWFGTRGDGLARVDPRTGATRTYRHAASAGSLSHDYVASLLVDGPGTLWAATDAGIDRFDPGTNTFRSYRPGSKLLPTYHSIAEEPGGALWLASSDSGLDRFDPATEEFTLYKNTLDDDRSLAHDRVYSVYVDRSGAVWAATYRGLDRFNPTDGSFVHYNMRDGLPANTTLGVLEDDRGYLWITTSNGLAQFDPRTRTSTNYDPSDGLPTDLFSVLVAAAKSRSGEIFFGSSNGLVAVSPNRLRINQVAPPVHIEQIAADRRTYDAAPGLAPAPERPRPADRLHGANSLVAPEKIQFRIKLEGQDARMAGTSATRRAGVLYRSVPGQLPVPRVREQQQWRVERRRRTRWHFSIAPAYYQTRWFQALVRRSVCGAAVGGLPVAVRQVHHQFDLTLEARVGERTRIARELHDTLLQSFHGLLLRFQTASYLLPERPAEAKQKLDSAIEYAAKAITEGRDAVQGLRSSTVEGNDLAMAIRTLGDELATGATSTSAPHSVSESRANREISARSFVTRSTRLRRKPCGTAFRHAQAGRVEVEIRYDNDAVPIAGEGRWQEASIQRCSRAKGSRDTTDCAACRNAPH